MLLAAGVTSVVVASAAAQQSGPTAGDEMLPPFDMRYFVGAWEIEWTPLETPLLPGGRYPGTETVRHIENGRYFDVTVTFAGPEGTLNGKGIMLFESGAFGIPDQIRGLRRRFHPAPAWPPRR